ncbi:hypothetical protein BDR07DRAFT_160705 [Suillus spraguei]|nr:hypothetical protein BDR07DRAFT_160705 [Suillus spraguei]
MQLVEMHKDGCPWRTRQCDCEFFFPLSCTWSPSLSNSLASNLPRAAASTSCHGTGHQIQCARSRASVTDVMIKHPLSTSQLASLRSAITSVKPPLAQSTSENESAMHIDADPESSDTAIVTALFGWSLAPACSSLGT